MVVVDVSVDVFKICTLHGSNTICMGHIENTNVLLLFVSKRPKLGYGPFQEQL